MYEYPRETSDSDSEGFDSPTHQHWNSLMLQSTQQPQVDYSSFAGLCLLIIIQKMTPSVTANDVCYIYMESFLMTCFGQYGPSSGNTYMKVY